MEKSVSNWQLAGFVFTGTLGTFLHFLFDLTQGSILAALVSAVNESIWEHMKLLFYPMLFFALIEYFVWGKVCRRFWCVKLVGIGMGLLLIPVFYYTYTGSLGVSIDWFNITIFFISAALVFWTENRLFRSETLFSLPPSAAVTALCLLVLLFTVLTFSPPRIPLFRDPATGAYGLQKILR